MSKAIMIAAQCGAEVEREWSSQARTTFKSKKTLEAYYAACAAEKDKEIAELKSRIAAMEEPVAIVDGGVLNWIADRQIQNGLLYAAPTQRHAETAGGDKYPEKFQYAIIEVEPNVELMGSARLRRPG